MAEITFPTVRPSLATVEPGYEHQLNGLIAGETLDEGQFVYIKASDGRVYKATGAAANEAARARGVVLMQAVAGDGVTVLSGVTIQYVSGANPGTPLFLSGATAGQLADAASTGGTTEIAYVVDANRIKVKNL